MLKMQKDFKLIHKIDIFASNAFTRMLSRQKLMPFGGDRRKYRYRVALLTAFSNLENTLEDFEASVLGSSGKSIFMTIQYLANAKRQLAKILGILKAYSIQEDEISDYTANNVDEDKIENNNINEIIKDFDINKLNFDYTESNKFNELEQLISAYNSGNLQAADQISKIYSQLINELAKGSPASSLEDILILRSKNNNLETTASFSNWIKKWYGKARHHMSMFDETSPVRVDVSNIAKEALNEIQDALNFLEKDLNPYDIFEIITSLNKLLISANKIMEPLIESIHGSSFGNTFLKMIDKNKLTDFPANLSAEEKKSFQTYLKTREFKDLLNMYSGDA